MEPDKKLILVISISLAASLGMASAQASDEYGDSIKIHDGQVPENTEPAPDAVVEKFDAGFYQKIQNLIESDRARLQSSHQKTQDPEGAQGASDDQRYYSVIIVVGRDGQNPDDTARQNKHAITRHLNSLGARDIAAAKSLSFVTASIPVSEIPGLSLREEIHQMGDGELILTAQVDIARQTIHATPSDLQRSVGWEPNGTGTIVAVIDNGINSTHLNNKVADRVFCNFDGCHERSGDNSTRASHGTLVAGIIAASNMSRHNGIAPGVTLLDAEFNLFLIDLAHALDWSSSKGADVVNISLGTSSGCYDTISINIIMNEASNKGMVIVNSAGNEGYLNGRPVFQSVSPPGCAHNLITVGGINDRNNPEITMYTSSSRGPIHNLEPRLVPHMVAPAVNIQTLNNVNNDDTSENSGTSLVAPQISAAAAIILQIDPELAPAGVRAALLLGANWTGPVPCTSAQYEQNNTGDPCSYAMQPADENAGNSLEILNNVGFGILNVAESLRYANSSSHIISDHLNATTGPRTYELDVTDASVPVKIILTWMVNRVPPFADLSLEIFTPNGSVINASSVYQTTEFAVFDPPAAGKYEVIVQVRPDSLNRPNQTFALASTSSLTPVTIAIDAVENQTVNVHSTLRLDITARNATGPVRYGIDPLEGAYIHPVSGHLVYVPVASQQGLQNITVRAADNQTIDSITIQVAVGEPVATVTGIEAWPDGTHVATVDVGPDDVTGMFEARTHADTAALSDPATSDAGTNAAQFTSDILGSDHPKDDTIYYFVVWLGSSPDPDDRIYARFTPGQNGSGIIIPNPGTRPAHYVPDLDVTVGFDRSVTVAPHLTDNDGNPVRITGVTDGTEGTARTNGTAVTYTLNAGAAGDDTITYTVTDNAGLQVNGTIATEFEPFVIDMDSPTVRVHGTLRLDIGAQNAKGPVTWSIDEKAGALIHPVTGHLAYLPPPGSEGLQTLTVRAGDGIRNASVDIDVNVTEPIGTIVSVEVDTNLFWFIGEYIPNNPTPDVVSSGVFYNGSFMQIGSSSLISTNTSLSSSANLSAAEPDALYFLVVRSGIFGLISADSNIFVRLALGEADFTIMRNPFTRPDPFAPEITVSANATGMPISVTPELTGMDGGALTITNVTNGTRGTAGHTDTTITYTPDADVAGTDTINYTVTDDRGVSSIATATIVLLDIPLDAQDDMNMTDEDVPVSIPVLDNDAGNNVIVTVTTLPGNGTAEPESDGTITYTPHDDYNGPDSFEYTISRGDENRTAMVTVTVKPVDDPITFEVPQSPTGTEFIAISKLEPYRFNINVANPDSVAYTLNVTLGEPAAEGAAIGQDGTFRWMPTVEQGGATYPITINLIPKGRDVVSRQIMLYVSETYRVPVSDTAIIGMLEAYMSRGFVAFAGVFPDSGDITATILTGAAGPDSPMSGLARFLLAGIIINTTDTGRTGPADWDIAGPDDITVLIRELGNVPPVLFPVGNYSINAHDTLTFTVPATDFGSDAISYRLSGAPADAAISGQGSFSWMPSSADVGDHNFTITAHDGHGGADTQSVTITVLSAGTPNESPIAPDVTATVAPDDTVIIIPAMSDPDGDRVSITGATGGAGGTITPSDNRIEYTAGSTLGAETITYTVADSRGANATGTITITIR